MSRERDVNAYSPDGRIYQLEYAMKASNLGTTTIALTVRNATILISEKKILTPLQVPSSLKKHYRVYDHIMLAFSGISGDAKRIIKLAREYCLYHQRIYNEKVPVEGLLKYLCRLSLQFGEEDLSKKIFSRPFGAHFLICGYDSEAKMYSFDPSGSYRRYNSKSIGGGSEAVESEMNVKLENVEDGILKGLGILKRVMKDEISKERTEVAISDKDGLKFLTENEIDEYLQKI